jgi:hypothetical protein
MFGFVNSNKEERKLGGEIFEKKQKTQRVIWSVVGVLVFVLLNVIFYLLTRI